MFIHFTNGILVLFSLVSIYMTHKMSSHFREGYIVRQADRENSPDSNSSNNGNNNNTNDGVRYNKGTFDLETWSCELKTVEGAMMVWEDYGKQCSIEMASRGIMIPFVVVGFVLAGLSIWQMIGGRRDADGERMKTEDVGLEMGKFNAI